MPFEIIDTGKCSAEENMAYDALLLDTLDEPSKAILHFYEWQKPSATYGYFSKPLDYLNASAIAKYGLDLAKRPTGGGVIFHQYDLAFSFLLSASHPLFSLNTLSNYSLVNTIVANAITAFSEGSIVPLLLDEQKLSQKCELCKFCMSSLTVYDVTVGGKKIAGAAQRRTKRGFLHQGSIAVAIPPENFLADIFLPRSDFASAMKDNTFPLLSKKSSHLEIGNLKRHFADILSIEFQKIFN